MEWSIVTEETFLFSAIVCIEICIDRKELYKGGTYLSPKLSFQPHLDRYIKIETISWVHMHKATEG